MGKVLIFDSNEGMPEVISCIFKHLRPDFSLELAKSCYEAREKADSCNLVITNNLQLTKEIRANYKGAKILFISGNLFEIISQSGKSLRALAKEAGADSCLAKPFSVRSFLRRIGQLL